MTASRAVSLSERDFRARMSATSWCGPPGRDRSRATMAFSCHGDWSLNLPEGRSRNAIIINSLRHFLPSCMVGRQGLKKLESVSMPGCFPPPHRPHQNALCGVLAHAAEVAIRRPCGLFRKDLRGPPCRWPGTAFGTSRAVSGPETTVSGSLSPKPRDYRHLVPEMRGVVW